MNAIEASFSSEIRTNPAQAAVEDIQLMLTRKCVKGDEIRQGDIIIKRDDSYRIDSNLYLRYMLFLNLGPKGGL